MVQNVFYSGASGAVIQFFNDNFVNFDEKLLSRVLNMFTGLLNYQEEGQKFRPNLLFTNNIETLIKNVKEGFMVPMFEDEDPSMFESRMKPLISLSKRDWCIYTDIKENKISYGVCKAMTSIKEKNLLALLNDNDALKEKSNKVFCIVLSPINSYCIRLSSLMGNTLYVNFSLDDNKMIDNRNEISEFVDATFEKVRTTQKKLNEIKTMYKNIFTNVINEVNGTICVVVDKEYKDNGLFADGIWLKEPISFSKLFFQSKSYNEEKLGALAELFMSMLNFDGITVVDNLGRIRAYNVFVEANSKKLGHIVGGARKRAAYTVLNTKKRGIIGVYFQSHDGEMFFKLVGEKKLKKRGPKPKPPLLEPVSNNDDAIITSIPVVDEKTLNENIV